MGFSRQEYWSGVPLPSPQFYPVVSKALCYGKETLGPVNYRLKKKQMCISSSHPEKAMAPHSGTLAWKIPWAEEPGRLDREELDTTE